MVLFFKKEPLALALRHVGLIVRPERIHLFILLGLGGLAAHGFAAALPPGAETVFERTSDIPGSSPEVPRAREVVPPGGKSWVHVPPGAREPFGTPYGAATVTHVNLNDGVVEGIKLLDKPAFAVQYHPEAAPGPHDAVDLFDQFATLMETTR